MPKYDSAITECDIPNVPRLCQTDPEVKLVDPKLASFAGVGCYDTTIVTISITVLANRGPALTKLSGRTAIFDAIQAGKDKKGGVVSKEVEQLIWQYQRAKEGKPFYFHELVSDFGRIQQTCKPHVYGNCRITTNAVAAAFRDFIGIESHLTNEYVIGLLRGGFVVGFGFCRMHPIATTADGANLKVCFEKVGLHKVVLAGFRPGTYGLTIMDVGSGTFRYARLVSGFDTRGFGDPHASGTAIKQLEFADETDPKTSTVLWQFAGSRRTFLEFEDENDVGSNVNFIEHLDALSLEWAPPKQIWEGALDADFTHFVPFLNNGEPCFIAYSAASGLVHFDSVNDSAQGSTTQWSGTWGIGFTHLVPFSREGGLCFIAYNAATGKVRFDRIYPDFNGSETVWEGTWGTGWSTLMPFDQDDGPHLLAYNKTTGKVHFDRINDDFQGTYTLAEVSRGKGWSHFMPFKRGAYSHYLVYNTDTGDVHYEQINADGKGSSTVYSEKWIPGWSNVTAVPYRGLPHFTISLPADVWYFCRIATGAQGRQLVWEFRLDTFSSVMPFAQHDKSYQLYYNRDSGATVIYQYNCL